MARKNERQVVQTARMGDQRFTVPAVFPIGAAAIGPDDGPPIAHVTGEMGVSAAGVPVFRRVEVTAAAPMTAAQMAAIPWAKIARAACVRAEVGALGQPGTTGEVEQVHKREQRRGWAVKERRRRELAKAEHPNPPVYRRRDAAFYAEVLRLKAEAEAQGVPYAEHVATALERNGHRYSTAYVRQLVHKAKGT